MENQSAATTTSEGVYINTATIFSGIKNVIFSQDFRGGSITNVFGETELDFSNADITRAAILNISQAFANIKITIPRDWRIESEITELFASVRDKRIKSDQAENADKTLVLKGISVCAGVDIINGL